MSDSTIVELPDGIKFKLPNVIHSGDERYIVERRISGEEYVAHGFVIKPGDTIIDIGAHIGRFALYAATKSAHGRVYAFEPQPDTRQRLTENIELNNLNNIILSPEAVAGGHKKILLHTYTNSARSSIYGESPSSVEVESIPLAEVFERNAIVHCSFIKCDCEGAEFEIFFALPRSYFSKIDKIVLEFHDHLSTDKKMIDLFKLFSEEGYALRVRFGAFYTGLLFARKSMLPKPLLLARNYMYVYGIDFSLFCMKLFWKKVQALLQPTELPQQ